MSITCEYHKKCPKKSPDSDGGIFEISHGRSGTRSVCRAVQLMGITAMHGFGRCRGCERDFIDKYLEGDCNSILYKRASYFGNVSIIHWKLLLRDRPKAKFVLCIRPIKWWLRTWKYRWKVLDRWRKKIETKPLDFIGTYLVHLYGMAYFDEDIWRHSYLSHIHEVKRIIPESKLLVMNIFEEDSKTSWGKLADFLSVEPPNLEFPRLGLGSRL